MKEKTAALDADHPDPGKHKSERKPYRAPTLTKYGDLRSVVLSGSAVFPEDSTSAGPRSIRR